MLYFPIKRIVKNGSYLYKCRYSEFLHYNPETNIKLDQ